MTRKRVIAFGAVCIMFLSIGLFSATQDKGSLPKTPSVRPSLIRAAHSFYSFASTDSAPSSGDACVGDIADVCQRVQCRCCSTDSAIG